MPLPVRAVGRRYRTDQGEESPCSTHAERQPLDNIHYAHLYPQACDPHCNGGIRGPLLTSTKRLIIGPRV